MHLCKGFAKGAKTVEQAQLYAQIRKRALTIVNLLVAAALVALIVGAELIQTMRSSAASATSAATDEGAPLITVAGGSLSYTPATLTVRAGTAVKWQGNLAEHPLISVDGLWQRQASGETFSYTFTKPGTYGYYCQVHGGPGGGMAGEVVVQP